ncbi:MAG: AAA domain-containing protein [Dongiaceae bacterium]
MVESSSSEPKATNARSSVGVVSQICAYFRDFLDTDFRRQRMPKRSIGLKDPKGNLTGISISKYTELIADLWRVLGKPLDASRQLSLSVARGRYLGRVNKTFLDVVEKHVAALEGETLLELGDRAKATARELRAALQNDPERYREAVVTSLRNDLVRTVVTPLTVRLESSIREQGRDEFEVAYDIEDEIGTRLVADTEEAIGSALAAAIVEDKFTDLDTVIDDVVDSDTVRRRLTTYFETFRASDFFQELHELRSTLKLRENFETYLYVGSLHHNRVAYPLFYIPLQIELSDRLFHITADPRIYINKKALEYAAQETARESQRPIPLSVKDRIVFLDDNQTYLGVMQSLLDQWCADLALKPPLDLSDPIDQKAQRSQLSITNAIHFSAFDKADESLLNDYEELLTNLASGSEAAVDFQKIVAAFLTTDPINVNADIDREWAATPIEARLVYQSPVPLNEEQRKILAALKHPASRFLSIEGPPGTGKSHTITAIVFEAILNGKNVLVLSDKTEALDVVEAKLNDVLNSVRFGEDFQNPILRLGRAGNTYSRILSSQTIEAIRAHHTASNLSQSHLKAQIDQDEARLSGAIRETVHRGGEIKLGTIHEVQQQEAQIETIVPRPDDLIKDQAILNALRGAGVIAEYLSNQNFCILRILRAAYQQVTVEGLEQFLKLQELFGQIALPDVSELRAIQFFSTFRSTDVSILQRYIAAYQSARWPVLGYLFTGRQVRALDTQLASELSPTNALNAHRNLDLLERAHATFARISSALTRSGALDDMVTLAFQQSIDGLPARNHDVLQLLDHVARICHALEQRPTLRDEIGLDPNALAEWTREGTTAGATRLREMIAYAARYKELQDSFRGIPDFDYAGDKAKLETLHAHRLAHKLDGQVIQFADNYRNLSRSIRDIIRKKQHFPKEDFAVVQQAFPCIIASIRDYAEYIPLERGLFDIVIIDEASQVSIAQAFPAFLRAKKLVVLGDRKQFSNVKTATASIETNNQYTNAIIKDFRKCETPDVDTLNRLKLFNIKTSVLEFVERIANSQAMLRKHFRGYPELISFSSKTFYRGQLQAVKIRGVPADDVIRFTAVAHDGRQEVRKNVNSAEWQAILAELRRLAGVDEPPSVGIITPFSEQQIYVVQQLNRLPDGERLQSKLKLKVMTFDSCQGDERDIIMYSLVATPQQDKLSYIFPKNLDEADEVDHALRLQRLNVGFSRAKERIHFFHSMPLDTYRGAIAKAINHYVIQLEIARKRPTGADTDPKSPMEKQVLSWLEQTLFVQNLGERVEIDAQFELGTYLRQLDPSYRHPAYRVDFLMKVQSDKGGISIIIEYDGFKEHFTDLAKADAYNYEDYYRPEDVERQKVLEGYGYRFLRINRFNLGRDPVRTLDARLLKLTEDAIHEAAPHGALDEVKETTEGLMSGNKKLCRACGQVRDLDEFRDPALQGRIGRKCLPCKTAAAASNSARTSKAVSGRRRRQRW